jgi:hypothetical protein
MSKLKVVLPGILLLVLALYGAFKAYIYYHVRSGLEDAVAMARPFGTLRYSGIASSLDGAVGVEGLEIRPQGATQPLRIGFAQLRGPGIGFLLELAGGKRGEQLPGWMELSLERVELPHVLDLYPGLDSLLHSDAALSAAPPPPCSLGGLVGDQGLYGGDRFPLRLAARLGYRTDLRGGPAQFYMSYGIEGGESLMLDLILSEMPSPQAAVQGKAPNLERFTLTYQPEAGRITGPLQACAGKAGVNVEQFVAGLMVESDREFVKAFGVVPGPGLRQALQRFLLNPGEVRLSAAPDFPLMRASSLPTDPKALLAWLDPNLTVAGERVTDLSLRLPSAAAADASAAGRGAGQAATQAGAGASPAARATPERRRPRFVVTPVAELGRYLQREVKVHTPQHAQPLEGTLIAMDAGELSIERRVSQGKWTVHVPLRDVQKAEVLRLDDEAP